MVAPTARTHLLTVYVGWDQKLVYASLAVRLHFLCQAENDLAFASIIQTRASLCELLAMKLLRQFTNDQLELAAVLTYAWNPLRGAPRDIYEQVKREVGDGDLEDPSSALEVSRLFLWYILGCVSMVKIGGYYNGIQELLCFIAGAKHRG